MRIALLLAALFAATAAASPPITKVESRTLPERVVVQRVFDQIADLLTADRDSQTEERRAAVLLELAKIDAYDSDTVTAQTVAAMPARDVERLIGRLKEIVTIWPDPYHRKHPRFPLSQITFETKPRASAMPGVCIVSDITTNFRVVDHGSSPSAKTRVREVLADSNYYFPVPLPSAVLEPARYAARRNTEALCAGLDKDKSEWFQADDVRAAVKAAWLLQTVRAAAKSDAPLPYSLTCEDTSKPCRAGLAQALDSKGWWVSDCGALHCRLSTGSEVLEVWHPKDAPEKMTKVDYHLTVTLADPLAD